MNDSLDVVYLIAYSDTFKFDFNFACSDSITDIKCIIDCSGGVNIANCNNSEKMVHLVLPVNCRKIDGGEQERIESWDLLTI